MSAAPTLAVPPADPTLRRRFLDGMSHAACTVNVVTTAGAAGRHGVTVSAMVSVSADTPLPTLLVCIHDLSPVIAALLANGVFCVSVLREDQAHISDSFAGRSGAHGSAKFDCTDWRTQVTGAPRVADALVAFDCRVTASERVGSHWVVFGSVVDIHVAGTGAPLIYANRAYGVPQHFHARGGAVAAAAALAGPPPVGGSSSPGGSSPAGRSSPLRASATLKVGCFATIAPYIMPTLVARLAKRLPAVTLTLVEAEQAQLLASLRHGETDLALLYDFGLGADLCVEPLAELTPYVLLADGHPLASAATLSLEQLALEPLILLDIEPSRDYFLSLFRSRGLEPALGPRTRSLEMVRGLVGHGLGYALLATKPANNMSYDGRALVARPLAYAVANSRLVLATRADRAATVAAQDFIGHCRAFFHGSERAHAHP